ncbi:hypothetical protein [Terrarubrum flagellatum]|uniref:hypothetical protein n=1 Tax=Terrirubrum flagellatum TaxID=2895980 RepID=UPI0031451F45
MLVDLRAESVPQEKLARAATASPPDATRQALLERRSKLREAGIEIDEAKIPPGSMGLALSGGGIRSATISLGFVQSLARHDRLYGFDYLSTVSGGGYFGSFLTSLFLPQSVRGRSESSASPGEERAKDTREFAESALKLEPREETLDTAANSTSAAPARRLRNPIWWLREHGRYLAPNGATDYGFAVAYIARNWLAMIYTFFIASAAAWFLLLGAEWLVLNHGLPGDALQDAWPKETRMGFVERLHYFATIPAKAQQAAASVAAAGATAPKSWAFTLSPLVVMPPALLAITIATWIAYWITVSLRTGNLWNSTGQAGPIARFLGPTGQFLLQSCLILFFAACCGVLINHLSGESLLSITAPLKFWKLSWPLWSVSLGVNISILGAIVGLGFLIRIAPLLKSDGFVNEMRRRLTALSAGLNIILALACVTALIDSLALTIIEQSPAFVSENRNGLPIAAATFVPALAWVIAKIPTWLGDGKLARFVGAHVWTIALIVGAAAFFLVALTADLAIHAVSWNLTSEGAGLWVAHLEDFDLKKSSLLSFGAIALGLFILTGLYTGFINLSSLHSFYAGRLTRAYLGASNRERLEEVTLSGGRPITENHPKDYIDVSTYQQARSAAPLHLINVTLNETQNTAHSQLADRDRKGVPLVFAPEGVYINAGRAAQGDARAITWDKLKEESVESLSVGQLCAISGAAASAGMGARTTLGGALAFTFANIRLGYWWDVRDLLPEVRKAARSLGWRLYTWITRPWRTYYYLWCEMTALYTRRNRRVYLSDGGHFENSGAYELLRRRVPLIVVIDNGADPSYEFEDMENLIRKARLDLGLSIEVASAYSAYSAFGFNCSSVFINAGAADWRRAARNPDCSAFALLLDVFGPNADAQPSKKIGRIIWLKPRLFDGLPADVENYGHRNPPFPQQTTGDQFFDEAQWESYRALGFAMGTRLLRETNAGSDVFADAILK